MISRKVLAGYKADAGRWLPLTLKDRRILDLVEEVERRGELLRWFYRNSLVQPLEGEIPEKLGWAALLEEIRKELGE